MWIDKKKWPFKIGTTSFIYPGNWAFNVKKLGRFFDEIELLVFESRPETVLPSRDEVEELKALSLELGVTYNIHLPVDISLSHVSTVKRKAAIDILARVVDLFSPLNPTTHTLHLDMSMEDQRAGGDGVKRWQEQVANGLEGLVSKILDPGMISVETLDYPFYFLDDLIRAYGLAVCMDAGHLIRYGFSINDLFKTHGSRIPLVHLHGVDFSFHPPKDHQGLDKTPDDTLVKTVDLLKQFKGVVSIEVFNYDSLAASVTALNSITV